jgi:hypothetical protein
MNSTVRDFYRDGSWLRVELAAGRLSILFGEDGQPGPWDIEYRTATSERYVGTVATLADLASLMAGWKRTGECLHGRYLWIADLIVVEQLNASAIADLIEDLTEQNELRNALSLVDDDR